MNRPFGRRLHMPGLGAAGLPAVCTSPLLLRAELQQAFDDGVMSQRLR